MLAEAGKKGKEKPKGEKEENKYDVIYILFRYQK